MYRKTCFIFHATFNILSFLYDVPSSYYFVLYLGNLTHNMLDRYEEEIFPLLYNFSIFHYEHTIVNLKRLMACYERYVNLP
jgi:hypothetical protein